MIILIVVIILAPIILFAKNYKASVKLPKQEIGLTKEEIQRKRVNKFKENN